MKFSAFFVLIIQWTLILCEDPKVNQVNDVNPDGSFQFGFVLNIKAQPKSIKNQKICRLEKLEKGSKP